MNNERLNLVSPVPIFDVQVDDGERQEHHHQLKITYDIVKIATETLLEFVPVIKSGNHYRDGLAEECADLVNKCEEIHERERR